MLLHNHECKYQRYIMHGEAHIQMQTQYIYANTNACTYCRSTCELKCALNCMFVCM